MDNITSVKPHSAQDEITALARQHGVSYQPTDLDALGNAMTRLAGDDVELDETELLLLALRRAGHVTKAEAVHLHGAYLRAKYE
jgi:hypothetical protein